MERFRKRRSRKNAQNSQETLEFMCLLSLMAAVAFLKQLWTRPKSNALNGRRFARKPAVTGARKRPGDIKMEAVCPACGQTASRATY
jgi:hypothetical protein